MLRCDTWDLLGLLMKRGLIGCALGAALILPALSTLPASADQVASGEDLYILTSQDAGTAAYDGPLSTAAYRRTLVAEQDATLASLGIDKPVHLWTTALSGRSEERRGGEECVSKCRYRGTPSH